MGARLCTSEELANDEAKGGGCKADCKGVWSADTCDGGHTWQAGAAKCLKDFPSACGDSSAKAAVRCCADSGRKTNLIELMTGNMYTMKHT